MYNVHCTYNTKFVIHSCRRSSSAGGGGSGRHKFIFNDIENGTNSVGVDIRKSSNNNNTNNTGTKAKTNTITIIISLVTHKQSHRTRTRTRTRDRRRRQETNRVVQSWVYCLIHNSYSSNVLSHTFKSQRKKKKKAVSHSVIQ